MSGHFPDISSDGQSQSVSQYSIPSGQTETDPPARPPVKVSDLQLGQGGQTGAGRTSGKYKLLGLNMSRMCLISCLIKTHVTTKHSNISFQISSSFFSDNTSPQLVQVFYV